MVELERLRKLLGIYKRPEPLREQAPAFSTTATVIKPRQNENLGLWLSPKIYSRKEKAHSVVLLKGRRDLNPGHATSDRCKGCLNVPELVCRHHSILGLQLYGCKHEKCRKVLIKVEMNTLIQGQVSSLASSSSVLLCV